MAGTIGRAGRRSRRPRSSWRPSRRYWAVVGNGPNRIAAEELRIKLSELCYKSIACDATEDKKHIDLSSEPLILVCAAGLAGSTADDVAKEVAIYRAHKAAPIVIATEGEERFAAALQAITVPAHRTRSWPSCSSAMAGHLFGYEAALAIDAQARPLREARAAIEAADRRPRSSTDGDGLLAARCARRLDRRRSPLLRRPAQRRLQRPPRGQHRRAAGVAAALRHRASRRSRPTRSSTAGSARPGVVVEDLTAALTPGIEELTRPVDAIKHQAKTVTVGISRSDERLLQPAGAGRARRRRRPRPAQLPHARARWPTSTRRSPRSRLHPLPRSTAIPTTASATVGRRRPGRHRRATSRRAPSATRCCGAPSTGGHRAGGDRRPWPRATAARW